MAVAQTNMVVAVFDDLHQAQRARALLHEAGLTENEVHLVMRGRPDDGESQQDPRSYDTEEGATAGAVIGGMAGAAAAALVTLMVPGLGLLAATSMFVTALEGATVGALAGTLIGALVGLGVPEAEARYYEQQLSQGRAILVVEPGTRRAQVVSILRDAGAMFLQGSMLTDQPAPAP